MCLARAMLTVYVRVDLKDVAGHQLLKSVLTLPKFISFFY